MTSRFYDRARPWCGGKQGLVRTLFQVSPNFHTYHKGNLYLSERRNKNYYKSDTWHCIYSTNFFLLLFVII